MFKIYIILLTYLIFTNFEIFADARQAIPKTQNFEYSKRSESIKRFPEPTEFYVLNQGDSLSDFVINNPLNIVCNNKGHNQFYELHKSFQDYEKRKSKCQQIESDPTECILNSIKKDFRPNILQDIQYAIGQINELYGMEFENLKKAKDTQNKDSIKINNNFQLNIIYRLQYIKNYLNDDNQFWKFYENALNEYRNKEIKEDKDPYRISYYPQYDFDSEIKKILNNNLITVPSDDICKNNVSSQTPTPTLLSPDVDCLYKSSDFLNYIKRQRREMLLSNNTYLIALENDKPCGRVSGTWRISQDLKEVESTLQIKKDSKTTPIGISKSDLIELVRRIDQQLKSEDSPKTNLTHYIPPPDPAQKIPTADRHK